MCINTRGYLIANLDMKNIPTTIPYSLTTIHNHFPLSSHVHIPLPHHAILYFPNIRLTWLNILAA